MVMAVVLAASLAVVSCRKTDVEINDGSGSDWGVSEDIPMTFSVSADAHQPTKAVLVPDDSPDGNKLSIAGNQITVYDKLTVAGNPGYDMYINGRTAQYDADPVYDPADGSVIHPGWYFYRADAGQLEKYPYYWTGSGIHSFTGFVSKYQYDAAVTVSLDDVGLTVYDAVVPEKTSEVISDNDILNDDVKYPVSALYYNASTESLIIKEWKLNTGNQFDFMYAHHTRDLEDINELDPYRPVPLQMRHLFAAVQFNVVNLVPNDDAVSIESAYLNPIMKQGTAIIYANPAGKNPVDYRSITQGGTAPIMISYSPAKELEINTPLNLFANQGRIGDDGFLLIWPHDQDDFKNVELTLSGVKNSSIITTGSRIIKLADVTDIKEWEPGNKYIYNISIQDNRISITVTVVEWVFDDVVMAG